MSNNPPQQVELHEQNAIREIIKDASNDLTHSNDVFISKLKTSKFYNSLQILADNKFSLENLPYAHDALSPFISKETLELHHGKHHQNYLNAFNEQKKILDLDGKIELKYLYEYVLLSYNLGSKLKRLQKNKVYSAASLSQKRQEMQNLFNNCAQCLNHSFYWQSMRPVGANIASDSGDAAIKTAIFSHFDNSEEVFIKKFKEKVAHFASGWIWLVKDLGGNVFFYSTSNADTPLQYGLIPLFVCDIWEHAYYVDYRNRRVDYLTEFCKLINWEFVAQNYS